MRRRRKSHGAALGESLSFEEVLTIITVLLLLRVVFMVPMVNLDKAKTVAVRSDAYWTREVGHVLSSPSAGDAELRPYRAAFGLRDMRGFITRAPGGALYLEASTPDSSLVVVRHVPAQQRFVALRVHGDGQGLSFQRGRLLWSQTEGEWFIGSDSVDYGSHPASRAMEREFREWTRKERGY